MAIDDATNQCLDTIELRDALRAMELKNPSLSLQVENVPASYRSEDKVILAEFLGFMVTKHSPTNSPLFRLRKEGELHYLDQKEVESRARMSLAQDAQERLEPQEVGSAYQK